jgi:hypothetical protein
MVVLETPVCYVPGFFFQDVKMKTAQRRWNRQSGWQDQAGCDADKTAQLVLVFGTRDLLTGGEVVGDLKRDYPSAAIIGCSTSGHILGESVLEDSVVATAVRFDRTKVEVADTVLSSAKDSFGAGERLASQLCHTKGLKHVFVLSEGLQVNGSELVKGLASKLPASVAVTGGLSGDDSLFEHTLVLLGSDASPNRVVAVGLYGESLRVGYASQGGWDSFGPERVVTKSNGNVLYELDGSSALAMYKQYLGKHAAGLPATGLRFPLAVRETNVGTPIVRTILGINEQEQSLTFAGDIPEGVHARLMRTNMERLIDGAANAARNSVLSLNGSAPELAILISCVGRRLVMQQRTEEEVEVVREAVGAAAAMTGFYSYGEICPFTRLGRCELHNQTMTITVMAEAA